jgi:hypothetical protein
MQDRKDWQRMIKALIIIAIVLVCLFVLTFTVYFFNLDMKLVRVIYDKLDKHYDNLEKDKKL